MCAIKMIIFILIRKKENIGPKLLILQIIVIEGDDHVHPLLETDFPKLAHHSLQRVLLFVVHGCPSWMLICPGPHVYSCYLAPGKGFLLPQGPQHSPNTGLHHHAVL